MPAESVAAAVKTFIDQELVYGEEANFDEDADLIRRGVIASCACLAVLRNGTISICRTKI
jgi:hypothetical protein